MSQYISTDRYDAFVSNTYELYIIYRNKKDMFIEWTIVECLKNIVSISAICDEYTGGDDGFGGYDRKLVKTNDKILYLTLDGIVGVYDITTNTKHDIKLEFPVKAATVFSSGKQLIFITDNMICSLGIYYIESIKYNFKLYKCENEDEYLRQNLKEYEIDDDNLIIKYILMSDNDYRCNNYFYVTTQNGKLYKGYCPTYETSFNVQEVRFVDEDLLVKDVIIDYDPSDCFDFGDDFIIKTTCDEYYKCQEEITDYLYEADKMYRKRINIGLDDDSESGYALAYCKKIQNYKEKNHSKILYESNDYIGNRLVLKSDFAYYLNDNIHMPTDSIRVLNINHIGRNTKAAVK